MKAVESRPPPGRVGGEAVAIVAVSSRSIGRNRAGRTNGRGAIALGDGNGKQATGGQTDGRAGAGIERPVGFSLAALRSCPLES